MESTVVSLFSDYKHGKRFKSQPHTSADSTKSNTRTMPSLPGSKPRKSHPSIDSFHQVEISQRLRCTITPPPSLQSQSLPRIRLHGHNTRQRHHHSNSDSNPLPEKVDKRLFMPSIQYRATQSLPSLSESKMSGKSSKKSLYTKDPQNCSTFELFKTSRLGRRTASHRQNFAWDFSHRDDEVLLERNDNCFPTLGHGDTQSTRPVHLYMSVEMMDKLLEKRKGLRSDATLNALIGLSPSTKMNCNNKTTKEILKDSPVVKAVRMKADENNVQEITPSILKETTSEESKSEEPKPKEPKSKEPKSKKPKSEEPKSEEPKSEEPKSEEPKSDKDVDDNTSKGKTMSEDLNQDEMVCDFEDEEEAELGELEEEDGDDEFDAAEDEEEDADEKEDADEEEEELDEVSNDDVNEDFSGQRGEGDERPDTAEDSDGDCDDEEEDSGEELDKQDNDNSDDNSDEGLAGQDKDRGTEEEEDDAEREEGESDQDDEPVENDEEGGELSDEDGQNEASEDDAELISDDDGDE